MNEYRVTYFFTNYTNVVSTVQSDLPIDEFVVDFNHTVQDQKSDFINLIGDEPYLTINKNHLTFYKIETLKGGD